MLIGLLTDYMIDVGVAGHEYYRVNSLTRNPDLIDAIKELLEKSSFREEAHVKLFLGIFSDFHLLMSPGAMVALDEKIFPNRFQIVDSLNRWASQILEIKNVRGSREWSPEELLERRGQQPSHQNDHMIH